VEAHPRRERHARVEARPSGRLARLALFSPESRQLSLGPTLLKGEDAGGARAALNWAGGRGKLPGPTPRGAATPPAQIIVGHETSRVKSGRARAAEARSVGGLGAPLYGFVAH
jgi:hypothetical protein